MGVDIHQVNILISSETKRAYCIDGETILGEDYKSNWMEELVPGRCSDLFAILAGVKGDMFEITDKRNECIPEEAPKELVEMLKNRENACHSFTWYYMSDLLQQLKWVKKKIGLYIQIRMWKNPEFIPYGEMDEYIALRNLVRGLIAKLEKGKMALADEGKIEDFNASKVFFFFDS